MDRGPGCNETCLLQYSFANACCLSRNTRSAEVHGNVVVGLGLGLLEDAEMLLRGAGPIWQLGTGRRPLSLAQPPEGHPLQRRWTVHNECWHYLIYTFHRALFQPS